MIEDYGLPRWEPEKGLLVNNVLTLHTARALAGSTPVTTDPYDKGIGFDGVYAPRRFVQGVAEAAACGAPMVVKGTEFVEDGTFTLLSAERFEPQRRALGQIHRWLEEHAHLYEDRQNQASIGVLFPGEDLWLDWNRLAGRYFGVGQALIAAGLPWKVVSQPEHLAGLGILLTVSNVPPGWLLPDGLHIIRVTDLPGWETPAASLLARHDWLRRPVSFGVGELFRSYFHSRLMRKLLDRIGLAHFFMQSPLYALPTASQRQVLLESIGEQISPRVLADAPVLIEHWRRGKEQQVHLVNYGGEPKHVTVKFGKPMGGTIISPGKPEIRFETDAVSLNLDIYAVLVCP